MADHCLLTTANYQQVEKFHMLCEVTSIILQDNFSLKFLSFLSSKCQSSILYYFLSLRLLE